MRRLPKALLALMILCLPQPALAQGKPEKTDITLAIGGVSAQMYFVPVVLAERLGYFTDAGLKVTKIDTGSGAKGLQALVGGSADITAGSYEHPIRLQARGQDIRAFVKFGRFHGNVLGIATRNAARYTSPADMKGWKIGVSAPGSSSHMFAILLLAKSGLGPTDASFIAVTQGQGGVAAMRTGGELDAVSLTDPAISELESTKDIVVVADSRAMDGTVLAYGGETISGVLYTTGDYMTKYPNTVQAMTTAILRALDWTRKATPEEIMAKLPPEIIGQKPDLYRRMLSKNMPNFDHDGSFAAAPTEVTLAFLRKTDAELKDAKVDLTRTYDNRFVANARAAMKK